MGKQLVSKLKQSDFVKGVLSVGSGNLFAQIIQLVTLPLVSRIFSDQMYGEYALLLSTASVIISCASIGLSSAIMIPEDTNQSNKIFQIALLAAICVSGMFVGGLAVLSPVIQLFSISVDYRFALVLMLVYMIMMNFSSLLYVAVNRLKQNKTLMLNPLIGALMTLLITIPMGLLGFGSVSFLIAVIAGESIKVLHMLRHVSPFNPRIKLSEIAPILKESKRFVIFQGPANFINSLALQAPNQLFARFFDAGVLGNYAMCMRLLEYPITFLASPINTIYFRTATEYVHAGKNLSGFTLKMILSIFVCAAIPMAVLILFGEPLFAFVLGENWESAGQFASLFAFPLILKFCTNCVSYCRVALDKQAHNLIFCIVNTCVIVISIIVGFVIFHDLGIVAACYAFGLSLIGIFDLGLNFYLMKTNLVRYLMTIVVYVVFCGLCFALKAFLGI